VLLGLLGVASDEIEMTTAVCEISITSGLYSIYGIVAFEQVVSVILLFNGFVLVTFFTLLMFFNFPDFLKIKRLHKHHINTNKFQ